VTRARARGFTLLEVAIVLAISAIAALLVLPQWLPPSDPLLEPDAEISGWLADARQQAIAARQTVTVYVDTRAARVRMDTSAASGAAAWREGDLPRHVLAAIEPPGARARFAFRPTGAAVGDTLRVRTRDGMRQLTVDRWSGEVQHVAP
jgi:prepilin-type N-terminal cleavage/methylation domain-containing protein